MPRAAQKKQAPAPISQNTAVPTLAEIQTRLAGLANKNAAAQHARYLQAFPGGYGAGDQFLGIKVPTLRKLSREFKQLPLSDCTRLLRSKLHEERMLALFILCLRYSAKKSTEKEAIYRLYTANLRYVNNWDLVDSSAPNIVGAHMLAGMAPTKPLIGWAASKNVWERRVSILATLAFIRTEDFKPTLRLARVLLQDDHDLIHKAVGWMLREAGQKDRAVLEEFLAQHYKTMPRTMLRYAIEKFPPPKRQAYLKGTL